MSMVGPGATCRVAKGFMVLRPCAQPATAVCINCAKALCPEHTLSAMTGTLCPECAAATGAITDARSDTQWALRYRSGFYRASDDAGGSSLMDTLLSIDEVFTFNQSDNNSVDIDGD